MVRYGYARHFTSQIQTGPTRPPHPTGPRLTQPHCHRLSTCVWRKKSLFVRDLDFFGADSRLRSSTRSVTCIIPLYRGERVEYDLMCSGMLRFQVRIMLSSGSRVLQGFQFVEPSKLYMGMYIPLRTNGYCTNPRRGLFPGRRYTDIRSQGFHNFTVLCFSGVGGRLFGGFLLGSLLQPCKFMIDTFKLTIQQGITSRCSSTHVFQILNTSILAP